MKECLFLFKISYREEKRVNHIYDRPKLNSSGRSVTSRLSWVERNTLH